MGFWLRRFAWSMAADGAALDVAQLIQAAADAARAAADAAAVASGKTLQ